MIVPMTLAMGDKMVMQPRRALVAAAALALVIAACGGDGDTDSGSGLSAGSDDATSTALDASDSSDSSDSADLGIDQDDVEALEDAADALGIDDVREPAGHQQLQIVNATGVSLDVLAVPFLVDDLEAVTVATIGPGAATGFIAVPYWGLADDYSTTLYASGVDYPVGSGGFIFDADYGDDTRNFVVIYDDGGTLHATGGSPQGYDGAVIPDTAAPSGQAGIGIFGFPDEGGIFPNPFLLTDGAPGTCPDQRSANYVNGTELVFVDAGEVELNLYPDDRTDACQGTAPAMLSGSLDAGRLYAFVVTGPNDYSALDTVLVPIS